MPVEEIPRSFLYTCDNCAAAHRQRNAQGHYTESTPPKWSRLKIYRLAYEGDVAIGSMSSERLLCDVCTSHLKIFINGDELT